MITAIENIMKTIKNVHHGGWGWHWVAWQGILHWAIIIGCGNQTLGWCAWIMIIFLKKKNNNCRTIIFFLQRPIIIGCGNQALRWCTWVPPPAPCRLHHLQDYHRHFHCHHNYHFILQWAILILCGNRNLKWRTPAASLPSSSYPLLYNHYLNHHCPLSLSSFSSSLPPLSSGRDRFEVYWGRSRTLEVNIVRYNALPQLLYKYK